MPADTNDALRIKEIVLPIIDEYLNAYDNNINYQFWQNMVKFRVLGNGSGSYSLLSGWLQTLFPYLSSGEPNPYLRHWKKCTETHMLGPSPSDIPSQLSSVPLKWVHLGNKYPLHIHAGFRGVAQKSGRTLEIVLGWYATNDPDECAMSEKPRIS